jgi:hypothetical protein
MLNKFAVTFRGYNGNRNRTVEVEAADSHKAERLARIKSPGWHCVVDVSAI